MERLLVVGVPRSGTTWVGTVLATALDTKLLDEPDNHFVAPYAFRAKRRLRQGEYPSLRVGDEGGDYERLWRFAFAVETRRRSHVFRARRRLSRQLLERAQPEHVTRTLTGKQRPQALLRMAEGLAVAEQPRYAGRAIVVKSVYAGLSLEWLRASVAPRVVVVVRHPLSVLSSWLELDWDWVDAIDSLAEPIRKELAERYDAPVPSHEWSKLERAAWLCGALTSALADIDEVPERRSVVSHEALCRTGASGFRALVADFGLSWNPQADRVVAELNRPGRAYEVARVAEELENVWRTRLSPDQVREAEAVLAYFPRYHERPRVGVVG